MGGGDRRNPRGEPRFHVTVRSTYSTRECAPRFSLDMRPEICLSKTSMGYQLGFGMSICGCECHLS